MPKNPKTPVNLALVGARYEATLPSSRHNTAARAIYMKTVHKLMILSTALAAGDLCFAQDVGRVLSSTPVLQQVAIPRQVCANQQVAVQPEKSGAGAVMGAIAGGAMGNAVGGGAGRAAATVIGVIGGAMVGDRIEGSPPVQMQNVQRCNTQTFYENQTVGYNVVYEFGGRQYSVQMPNDPGPSIALQVSPIGASPQAANNPGYSAPVAAAPVYAQPAQPVYTQPVYAQPVYNQPPTVVISQPAYPIFYTRSYYPPVQLNFGYRWGGYPGYYHHGHGHY